MKRFLFTLFILSASMLVTKTSLATDDCPANANPVYCKIAKETGGKVLDAHKVTDLGEVLSNQPMPSPSKPSHQYSAFSKNIGCNEWTDSRAKEICQSISDHLEWGWTGHATISPGWKSTWGTARNVYCEQKVSVHDMSVLEIMCGQKASEYMSCLDPADSRLAVGVGTLINILRSQKELTAEFKGSVYDPQNENFLLKGGCE